MFSKQTKRRTKPLIVIGEIFSHVAIAAEKFFIFIFLNKLIITRILIEGKKLAYIHSPLL
jgi:hypothetical protein